MTPEERDNLEQSILMMTGQKYRYAEDVVTVTSTTFFKDIVTIETDIWTDDFDITVYDEWSSLFIPTKDESRAIGFKNEIYRLQKEVDRLEGVNAMLEVELEQQRKPVHEKPSGKTESIYPKLFQALLQTVEKIINNEIDLSRAVEIRELCRTASDISEVQNRVIWQSKRPSDQGKKKLDINKRREYS